MAGTWEYESEGESESESENENGIPEVRSVNETLFFVVYHR